MYSNEQRLDSIRQRNDYNTLSDVAQDILSKLLSGHRSLVGLITTNHLETMDELRRNHQNIRIAITADGSQSRSKIESESNAIRAIIHTEGLAIRQHITDEQSRLQGKDLAAQNVKQMKDSLWYPSMNSRNEGITAAHKTTFEWVFGAVNEQDVPATTSGFDLTWPDAMISDKLKEEVVIRTKAGAKFASWLKEGSGTYWINGKPGSGKSTLINVLFRHHKTSRFLHDWAAPDILLQPFFFFWNSGTHEQKSLLGCLKSLLYQCIQSCPRLVELLVQDSGTSWSGPVRTDNALQIPVWTVENLTTSLYCLITQTVIPCRFCLFLDGLDELDGSFYDLLQLLRSLSGFDHVKLCVSSRPLYDFAQAFKSDSSIQLEHFTTLDMMVLVRDRLLHSIVQKNFDQKTVREFSKDLVEKAEGVFLWLVLAVRQLEQGLNQWDSIEQLRARVNELPSDLDKMYTHSTLR